MKGTAPILVREIFSSNLENRYELQKRTGFTIQVLTLSLKG